MKSGASPELSASWWVKNKAKSLIGADLEKPLAAYEKPFSEFKKSPEETSNLTKALDALKKLPAAVKKTIEKCNSKLHKETIECLKKFDPLIKSQQRNIEVELERRKQVDKMTVSDWVNGPLKAKFLAFATKSQNEDIVSYLVLMKGKKGDRKIFDLYIATGSKYELNIDGPLRAKFCKSGDKTMKIPLDDLDSAPWDQVYPIVEGMAINNLKGPFQTELKGKDYTFADLLK